MKIIWTVLLFGTLASTQNINYFGVGFSPYVKNRESNGQFPYWNSYSLEDIKQMLRIVLTRHNAVSTYGMGVGSYNNGKPWYEADSNCLIARAAAQINRDMNSVVLSVSQGIHQIEDQSLQNREIENAFLAAADANSIRAGTVWGLTFTNEYVTNGQNGPKVLAMIENNRDRAHQRGLKVGTRIHTCGEIWGGPNQDTIKRIARKSDFIMCNLYPPRGNDIGKAVQAISDAYYSARDGLWRENPGLEVIIGETGWPSSGESFNNPASNNNVNNMVAFWNAMRTWSTNNKVKVQMFEAFDEPWKGGYPAESKYGWWYRPDNNQAVYIEKATGRRF